ncbi:MAG: hypothetical protein AAFZ52_15585, partial [Bacteroidota bacterium]
MRSLTYLLLFGVGLILAACTATTDSTTATQPPLAEVVTTLPPNATLAGIEGRIAEATDATFINYDPSHLEQISRETAGVNAAGYERLANYWSAYADFHAAVYEMKTEDKPAAAVATQRALDKLASIEGKNVEELTLQAFIQGFAVQFAEGPQITAAARAAQESIDAAKAIEPNNPRLQYVMGSMDFYTPAEYGGGKKAEGYLTRAIELPAQTTSSEYLPSWGKAEA